MVVQRVILRLQREVEQTPAKLVVVFCCAQFAIWTLTPTVLHLSPPIDVLEGYMWGREHVLLTFKHPTLPSWVLEGTRLVTGVAGWPAYFVSQFFVCTALVFLYLLGKDLMDAPKGVAAALVASGGLATSWLSPNFNNDIAQLPLWTGFAWMLWRAVASGKLNWWIGAAILGSLMLYSKLAGALLLLCAAAWLVIDAVGRSRLSTLAPWIALFVWSLLTAPLIFALIISGGQPFDYALARARGGTASSIPLFLLKSAGLVAGSWVILIAGLMPVWLRWKSIDPSSGTNGAASHNEERGRSCIFLLLVGPIPFVVLMGIAGFRGFGLKSTWAVPTFMLSTLFVVRLFELWLSPRAVVRIAMTAFAVLPIVAVAYTFNVLFQPFGHRPEQVSWPQAEIAKRLSEVWRDETNGMVLQIVAGDPVLAGMVAIGTTPMPSLFWRGSYQASPWITPERLARQGALLVWDFHDYFRPPTGPVPPPPEIYGHLKAEANRVLVIKWPRSRGARDLVIGYAILMPGEIR